MQRSKKNLHFEVHAKQSNFLPGQNDARAPLTAPSNALRKDATIYALQYGSRREPNRQF